jgi:hypothetical protein
LLGARAKIKAHVCADGWPSNPIASPPHKKNENRDQSRDDQHPVLAFKTQKYKTLDEKLHRSRPQFWAE